VNLVELGRSTFLAFKRKLFSLYFIMLSGTSAFLSLMLIVQELGESTSILIIGYVYLSVLITILTIILVAEICANVSDISNMLERRFLGTYHLENRIRRNLEDIINCTNQDFNPIPSILNPEGGTDRPNSREASELIA
jgi:hypothetical protein